MAPPERCIWFGLKTIYAVLGVRWLAGLSFLTDTRVHKVNRFCEITSQMKNEERKRRKLSAYPLPDETTVGD
jgi:hypothetical protein